MKASRWLTLAASPTFALMALATLAYGPALPICSAMGGDATGGMTAMYALMSLFHAAPWLALRGRGRLHGSSS